MEAPTPPFATGMGVVGTVVGTCAEAGPPLYVPPGNMLSFDGEGRTEGIEDADVSVGS